MSLPANNLKSHLDWLGKSGCHRPKFPVYLEAAAATRQNSSAAPTAPTAQSTRTTPLQILSRAEPTRSSANSAASARLNGHNNANKSTKPSRGSRGVIDLTADEPEVPSVSPALRLGLNNSSKHKNQNEILPQSVIDDTNVSDAEMESLLDGMFSIDPKPRQTTGNGSGSGTQSGPNKTTTLPQTRQPPASQLSSSGSVPSPSSAGKENLFRHSDGSHSLVTKFSSSQVSVCAQNVPPIATIPPKAPRESPRPPRVPLAETSNVAHSGGFRSSPMANSGVNPGFLGSVALGSGNRCTTEDGNSENSEKFGKFSAETVKKYLEAQDTLRHSYATYIRLVEERAEVSESTSLSENDKQKRRAVLLPELARMRVTWQREQAVADELGKLLKAEIATMTQIPNSADISQSNSQKKSDKSSSSALEAAFQPNSALKSAFVQPRSAETDLETEMDHLDNVLYPSMELRDDPVEVTDSDSGLETEGTGEPDKYDSSFVDDMDVQFAELGGDAADDAEYIPDSGSESGSGSEAEAEAEKGKSSDKDGAEKLEELETLEDSDQSEPNLSDNETETDRPGLPRNVGNPATEPTPTPDIYNLDSDFDVDVVPEVRIKDEFAAEVPDLEEPEYPDVSTIAAVVIPSSDDELEADQAPDEEYSDIDMDDLSGKAVEDVGSAPQEAVNEPQLLPSSAEPQESFLSPNSELFRSLHSSHPPNSPNSPNSPNCPDSASDSESAALSVLRSVFGLRDFRHNQAQIISATLAKKDVFVLMPTGGGKSLCYQLPALLSRGTTIVVSPLISLMHDQVAHLVARKIKAGMISSRGEAAQRRTMYSLFVQGDLQLLYVSPEMLSQSTQIRAGLTRLYKSGQLARIVIDEAHCVSAWGHDFRPDYKQLGRLRTEFPDVPIMALTATASKAVRQDVIGNLHMQGCEVYKQSFNRPNLYYEVRPKTRDHLQELRDVVASHAGQSGIVYCHSKNSCEQTAERLRGFGIRADFYHAGMDPGDRQRVQEAWQAGSVQVVCATIAFGMGIDKPDVRFVVHLFLPRNLEGYYQETGRAGRDGLPADCVLFYSYRDAHTLQTMIQRDRELDGPSREQHLARVRQVVQYCENTTDCRRKQVLHYFSEQFDGARCGKRCDNCRHGDPTALAEKDVTAVATDIIEMVASIQRDHVTLLHCQDVFRGSRAQRVLQAGHDRARGYGAGAGLEKQDVERVFFHLISEGVLEEYSIVNRAGFATSYLRQGPHAGKVLRGGRRVVMKFYAGGRGGSRGGSRGSGVGAAGSAGSAGPAGPAGPTPAGYSGGIVRASSLISSPEFTRLDVGTAGAVGGPEADHIGFSVRELRAVKQDKILLAQGFVNPQTVFPETVLRSMAVNLPQTQQEMLKIAGADRGHVRAYFRYFKPVLARLKTQREALKEVQIPGSSHTSTPEERSRYFQPKAGQPAGQLVGSAGTAGSHEDEVFEFLTQAAMPRSQAEGENEKRNGEKKSAGTARKRRAGTAPRRKVTKTPRKAPRKKTGGGIPIMPMRKL